MKNPKKPLQKSKPPISRKASLPALTNAKNQTKSSRDFIVVEHQNKNSAG